MLKSEHMRDIEQRSRIMAMVNSAQVESMNGDTGIELDTKTEKARTTNAGYFIRDESMPPEPHFVDVVNCDVPSASLHDETPFYDNSEDFDSWHFAGDDLGESSDFTNGSLDTLVDVECEYIESLVNRIPYLASTTIPVEDTNLDSTLKNVAMQSGPISANLLPIKRSLEMHSSIPINTDLLLGNNFLYKTLSGLS